MGGFYERLVGITKRALKKTLGNQCLTETQLTTILVEVEAVVNSPPLVYVDEDINSSMVLTPSDFLSLHSQHIIPDIVDDSNPDFDVEKRPTTAQQLLETWKRGQKRLSQFWSIWKNEYMLSLRERVKRKLHHQMTAVPRVGEIVLIKDNLPRGRWKVGKISELIMVRDQRVRSAKLLVAPHRYLHRPLCLLYPLECPDCGSNSNCDNQLSNQSEETEENDFGDDENPYGDLFTTCPRRKATVVARKKIKSWLAPDRNLLAGECHELRVIMLALMM